MNQWIQAFTGERLAHCKFSNCACRNVLSKQEFGKVCANGWVVFAQNQAIDIVMRAAKYGGHIDHGLTDNKLAFRWVQELMQAVSYPVKSEIDRQD